MEKGLSESDSTIVYLLQITKEKLCNDAMKLLKCLLMYILRTSQSKHIILEVYFNEEFNPIENHTELVLKMLVNGYNLLQPEHSKDFPLTSLEILFPQVFKNKSILLTEPNIKTLYFNSATNIDQVK